MQHDRAMADTFAELAAPPPLLEALTARGYVTPTPVQAAVVEGEARGRDLLVSSRTGSGKTVAFGLAMADELLSNTPGPRRPLALVVAPTRELANQVATELSWLFAKAGVRIATCVGGTDMSRELRALREGPHVVVGTPGRLCDHIERKSLELSALRTLVLDEADEMLDMGFRDELERILGGAPEERRTMMFSATIPKEIEQLARRYQKNALRLAATPPAQAHQDIEVRAHVIATREREHAVVNTLRFSDSPSAIVFCGTREAVNHLSANLIERGFAAVALSGELTQSERNRALKALRDGRARVLVATDVAARGLDLPDVGLIVQADLPQNAEVLQHRNGRTGRAGRKGVAVLLVPSSARRTAELMLRKAGVRATWAPVPAPDVIRVRDRDRLVRDIDALVRDPAEEDLALALLILRERSAEELAAALVKVVRSSLPAPEELPLSTQVLLPPLKGAHKRPDAAPHRSASASARPHQDAGAHKLASPYKPHGAERAGASKVPAAEAPRSRPEGKPYVPRAAGKPYVPRAEGKTHAPRPEGKPYVPRATAGAAHDGSHVWFRVNVGRAKNADPRWLLPLICRRGGVSKADIGKINILAEETRFEVTAKAARRFETASAEPDSKDPSVRIRAEK